VAAPAGRRVGAGDHGEQLVAGAGDGLQAGQGDGRRAGEDEAQAGHRPTPKMPASAGSP